MLLLAPIPSETFLLLVLGSLRLLTFSTKGAQTHSGVKRCEEILIQSSHIILTQQKVTLEIIGNMILEEGKGVDVRKHYRQCMQSRQIGRL